MHTPRGHDRENPLHEAAAARAHAHRATAQHSGLQAPVVARQAEPERPPIPAAPGMRSSTTPPSRGRRFFGSVGRSARRCPRRAPARQGRLGGQRPSLRSFVYPHATLEALAKSTDPPTPLASRRLIVQVHPLRAVLPVYRIAVRQAQASPPARGGTAAVHRRNASFPLCARCPFNSSAHAQDQACAVAARVTLDVGFAAWVANRLNVAERSVLLESLGAFFFLEFRWSGAVFIPRARRRHLAAPGWTR